MSTSWQLQASKMQLLRQLVFFDEQKSIFLDQYYPSHNSERKQAELLLDRYCQEVERLISRLDEASLHSKVFIGSRADLRILEDGTTVSFTLVFPQNARPDRSHISFLSPTGRQLLLAQPGQQVTLTFPTENLKAHIEDIKYVHQGEVNP